MHGRITLAIVLFGILHFECISSEAECVFEREKYSPGGLRINIVSERNQTGKWVTTFSAFKDDSEIDVDNDIAIDISQNVAVCNGKRTLIIQGHIVENDPSMYNYVADGARGIRFHPKCGNNAAIINNGRTVKKLELSETGYGIAFTNRPLNDNELFEVKLDKKSDIFKHSLGIGVTPYSPNDVIIAKFISELRPPVWSMYYGDLYYNRDAIRTKFAKSLDTVEVGDRVGIMKRSDGTLHYFINGVNLGMAASGINQPVYGLIELYANAAMATIV